MLSGIWKMLMMLLLCRKCGLAAGEHPRNQRDYSLCPFYLGELIKQI